ncbi:class II aaRS and biotin synthetase [Ceratobasidium sp. AG-I]|nr:class II aaRS and biotin synthetase [Ceratobasidium sp. AG-I]
MNGTTYPTIKRHHIAEVYRRDALAITKGRMREFYQCDFDIAGVFDPMVPDAEILCILTEALTALDIPDFTVKINHRKILDRIFGLCGVLADKVRSISSAVDKLDKLPWTDVRKEMVEGKGLEGDYVKLKGGPAILTELRATALGKNKVGAAAVDDMEILFRYLDVFGITSKMSFELSLARGLDYYTSLIYEAVVEGSAPPAASNTAAIPTPATTFAPTPVPTKKSKSKAVTTDADDESQVGVGSIAAGGRYDELVGMFSAAASADSKEDKGKGGIPCVGISVGVKRVFSILMQREKEKAARVASIGKGRSKATEVYVVSVGEGLIEERMRLSKELWDAGIKAEFMHKLKPKLQRQFEVLEKELIPYALIIGPDEVRDGLVNVKTQFSAGGEATGTEEKVPRGEVIEWLKTRLEGK